jgi:hypothetical protein
MRRHASCHDLVSRRPGVGNLVSVGQKRKVVTWVTIRRRFGIVQSEESGSAIDPRNAFVFCASWPIRPFGPCPWLVDEHLSTFRERNHCAGRPGRPLPEPTRATRILPACDAVRHRPSRKPAPFHHDDGLRSLGRVQGSSRAWKGFVPSMKRPVTR